MVLNVKRKVERRSARPAKGSEPDGEIGQALRSVYEKAVEEAIPREMLDLLGKLK